MRFRTSAREINDASAHIARSVQGSSIYPVHGETFLAAKLLFSKLLQRRRIFNLSKEARLPCYDDVLTSFSDVCSF